MRTIHIKGVKFSLPPVLRRYVSPSVILFTCKFTESCKYHIDGEDMEDWNKLCGLKALYFKPMFDTAMCGWRYSKDKDCFEIIPYFHLGSKSHTFDEKNILDIPVNTEFTVEIRTISLLESCYATVKLKCLKEISVTHELSKNYLYFWVVNSYFGGQSNAPKTMKFFIGRKQKL